MNSNVHPHSPWEAAGLAIVLLAFVPAAIYSAVLWLPPLMWPAMKKALRTIGQERKP